MAELIAFGEPLLEFARIRGDGRPTFLQGFGGDASTVAVAAARQGASVAMLARLGADTFGDAFEALWREEGIDVSLVQRDRDAPTGISFVDQDPRDRHVSSFRKGSAATRLRPELVPFDAIARARTLYLSGVAQAISTDSCDAAFAAIQHAREHGTRISYAVNLRPSLWPLPRARAVVLATVPLADDCLVGVDDASPLFGSEVPDELARALLDAGARTVLVRSSAGGALVASGEEVTFLPAHPVLPVDRAGAADAFDGAYLSEILRGADPVAAARYATVAAALSTQGPGAVVALPGRAETEAALRDGGAP